jgi:hypothetical protein
MRMLLTLTTATLLAAPVLASPQATLNECWGDVLSQFAQTQPGAVGQHSSADGTFTPNPGDGGRTGVGNVSKNNHTTEDLEGSGQALANGAQGQHAIDVGSLFGAPFLPEGSIEAETDPIECDGTPGTPP